MLVLLDGRTIYSPLFSGVFWDAQDVMLEDVERIEVISGPAATLWGSNGVNGVINITTLSSARTHGVLFSVGGGDISRGVTARLGGELGADGSYRVYGKYLKAIGATSPAAPSFATTPTAGRWDFAPTGNARATRSRSRATPTRPT
jgi:iron complex outermembrane receptor protein